MTGVAPGVFRRNWQLKIAAFFLAVLLWATVRVGAVSRQDVPGVPIRVQLTDPEWFPVGEASPSMVDLGVTGPARNLFRFALDRPSVVIPISAVSGEDTIVILRPDWVRMSDRQGVAIEGFTPSSVRLRFERRRMAPIPVSLRLTGELADSLALVEQPQVSPLFSQVSGPASTVENLETIFTLPFALDQIQATGEYNAVLDTTGLGTARVNPRETTVTFRLVPRDSRDLGIFPIGLPSMTRGFIMEPPEAAVVIHGAPAVIDIFDRSEVGLVVDPTFQFEGLGPGEEARVAVQVTGLTSLLSGSAVPDSVTLRREPGGPDGR